MIGPRPIRRGVLCTGPATSCAARYAAARLAVELPGVELHVYHQSGPVAPPATAPTRPVNAPPLTLRGAYWQLRRRWQKRADVHWQRRWQRDLAYLDERLAQALPRGVSTSATREVPTVNDVAAEIEALAPDFLLLFGGGRVSDAVLRAAGVALNIHGGKLPEYRGVSSALFALHDNRPDLIGVALHLATATLDGGDVVRWQAIDPRTAGRLPELLYQILATGIELAVAAVRQLPHQPLPTSPQRGTARTFRMRDLTPNVIRSAYRTLDELRHSATTNAAPAAACQ